MQQRKKKKQKKTSGLFLNRIKISHIKNVYSKTDVHLRIPPRANLTSKTILVKQKRKKKINQREFPALDGNTKLKLRGEILL